MKPGRELDSLVAAKVMGIEHPAPYSTSIEAAWEVVEKLKANGEGIRLIYHYGHWNVLFEHEDYCYNSPAESAPHAICLAALKTMGIKGLD